MTPHSGLRLLLVAACLCAPGCSYTGRNRRSNQPRPSTPISADAPSTPDHELIELQRELSLYSD